jgi:hypothetical protein
VSSDGKVKQYSLDNIICIDETSLNSFMIRRKCYEELGKRREVKTESQEVFKKYTGIFAISLKYIKREVLIVIEWLILLISL